MKATEQYCLWYSCGIAFVFVDEILNCGHSNESYWAALSCDTLYYAIWGLTFLIRLSIYSQRE